MSKFCAVLIFWVIYTSAVLPQAEEPMVFTYFNARYNELRAGLSTDYFATYDDLGFKSTFLPVWISGGILFCGENFIWRTNTSGEAPVKVGNGYKPTSASDGTQFAYYAPGGIQISDNKGKPLHLVEVDFWDDVSITWLPENKGITFYNSTKQQCLAFLPDKDSIFKVGDLVFQPVWNGDGSAFIYNAPVSDRRFGVFLGSGYTVSGEDILLTEKDKNNLIPVWNADYTGIYCFELLPDSLQDSPGALLKGHLKEILLESGSTVVIDSSAAYTDNVYPQFSVSSSTGKLYYSYLDPIGYGKIAVYDPVNKNITRLGRANDSNDYRFPRVRKQ